MFFALNSIFAAYLLERLSYKKSIILGSFGYISYLAAGFLSTLCYKFNGLCFCNDIFIYTINIFGAMLCGLGAGII